ncbi:MAG: hypothetical protein R6U89_08400, partial [Dehalococcoidia bacterium]
MTGRRFFIRNMEAGSHLEIFLVSAVATILAIRAYLHFTGYPQLGDADSSLHIAHMLWGGLMMLASIFILITFLGKTSENIAVILGGIGFGTFIDEVGKFITEDHDYFFKPSVAIIYATFIFIILIGRFIQTRRYYSETEYLMNAIHELEEIALHDLDSEEKARLLNYLGGSDLNNPLVSRLFDTVESADLVPTPAPSPFRRLVKWLQTRYRKLSSYRWFHLSIVIFFLFELISSLFYIVVVILIADRGALDWIEWALVASSIVSTAFVFWGILALRKSRLRAFEMFERSIMVSIFLTQVFVFYEEQFGA